MGSAGALAGVRVLDLSTLLPGPLATLALADAGADVIKVEKPGAGDEVRSYSPRVGGASAVYALLNRGKRAFEVDLQDAADRARVQRLAARAQVVVEQFRPGVADRLGLGYPEVRDANPGVVYCSITGYGQTGEHSTRAGHDLNYLAQSGLLGVVTDATGAPTLPVSNLADIAGGSYPAVVNILLGLRASEATGLGCHLDISMTHNLQVLAFLQLAGRRGGDGWPRPGGQLTTGASPRYQVYRTADGRHLAVAALEQKFWLRFCEAVGLPTEDRHEAGREDHVVASVAERVAAHTAEHWRRVLAAEDTCATVVDTFAEAAAAGLTDTGTDRRVAGEGYDVTALHSPVAAPLRDQVPSADYPALGRLPADVEHLWSWSPPHRARGAERP